MSEALNKLQKEIEKQNNAELEQFNRLQSNLGKYFNNLLTESTTADSVHEELLNDLLEGIQNKDPKLEWVYKVKALEILSEHKSDKNRTVTMLMGELLKSQAIAAGLQKLGDGKDVVINKELDLGLNSKNIQELKIMYDKVIASGVELKKTEF